MNKGRLEAFSDGVFSIVVTLLVFSIKLPVLQQPVTDVQLWKGIAPLAPIISVYFITFAVLSVLWVNHHFLFHAFAKSIDRWLNLLNLAYLMFVAFVPFSAQLIGEYPTHQPAALVYGINLLVIILLSSSMLYYMRTNREKFLSPAISQRLINQARFRAYLSISCYVIGIALSWLSPALSIFFYAFPVVFNIIPGTVDAAERLFGFDLGEGDVPANWEEQ